MTSHIKEGWDDMRLALVRGGANDVQIGEMRKAFYAGANYLMCVMYDNKKQTPESIEREVREELRAFVAEMNAELVQVLVTEGNA